MKPSRLASYLSKTNTKQIDLATRLKVSKAYMSLLVAGKKRPSPELAVRIEQLTGIPFRHLLLPENGR